jgi:hypothetical protein
MASVLKRNSNAFEEENSFVKRRRKEKPGEEGSFLTNCVTFSPLTILDHKAAHAVLAVA